MKNSFTLSKKKKYSLCNKGFIAGLIGISISYIVVPNAKAQDSVEAVKTELIAKPAPLNDAAKQALNKAISANRIDKERDIYRHPYETLSFFGIKPSDKIIEIWPGQGWYSSIISQYLKSGNGELIAAHFDTKTTNSPIVKQVVDAYDTKFVKRPEIYGNVTLVPFGPRSGAMGEMNSVDSVLTFRNIHNWIAQGWAEKAFADFFYVLKPGGTLGIEEHRQAINTPQDPLAADGYVREDYIIDLATEAGFELVDKSEINANLKDTKDYPFGVWTLPPVSRTSPQGQAPNPNFDSAFFKKIGESDRMTLLFRKPLTPKPLIPEVINAETDDEVNKPKSVIYKALSIVKPFAKDKKPEPTIAPVPPKVKEETVTLPPVVLVPEKKAPPKKENNKKENDINAPIPEFKVPDWSVDNKKTETNIEKAPQAEITPKPVIILPNTNKKTEVISKPKPKADDKKLEAGTNSPVKKPIVSKEKAKTDKKIEKAKPSEVEKKPISKESNAKTNKDKATKSKTETTSKSKPSKSTDGKPSVKKSEKPKSDSSVSKKASTDKTKAKTSKSDIPDWIPPKKK